MRRSCSTARPQERWVAGAGPQTERMEVVYRARPLQRKMEATPAFVNRRSRCRMPLLSATMLTGHGCEGRAMLEVTQRIRIPFDEFEWSFVRSGGPGGQNVNKVASKAVLRW